MSNSIPESGFSVEQEALSGRLPVLATERVYGTYGSFLWTCCAFSAATWAFLMGGFLPFVGDWRIGVMGYVIGLIIGMATVGLASGAASHRYGTDVIDAAKSSFGYRGIVVPLFGLLATLIGWSFVVEALTARGAANIVATISKSGLTGNGHEKLVVCFALVALLLVWLIASKGPKMFERLNGYVGPLHMLITAMMLGILVYRFGWHTLWTSQVPVDHMLTRDPTRGLALAVELGMSNSLTWWPVIGGLTRLVKNRSHIVGPSIIGVGLLGAALVSTVAALASISAGTNDPTVWMITLAGPLVGSLTMGVVLIANVSTMVVMVYLAGVSIQQIKIFSRIRWELLLAVMLLPGIYLAFKTEWLLTASMSFLSYNGVMFVGVTGVTLVDYFAMRRGHLDLAHLFATRESKYEFWGGVNWVAVAVTFVAAAIYLWLYNPVTSAMAEPFKYLGASIPVVVISGALYYVGMRLITVPLGKGSYSDRRGSVSVATLEDNPASGAVTVSL
ncbi:Cytosine/uracil/thiamine/allantoin permease [Paraburkholderia fungorum]|uniref:Cytosine/uracil/thiamine/allantoin permease n=1 Tax=Paraburkholderia fungorum TaxID=134537 RepID=A0A1H1JW07_9BURK|nr:cytosine permease [Paraburkholderia fungorum]SDR53815.1 Cytosine/uracil/thiamine/allantoin permease [Paraburkholderia fungorum]